MNISAGKIGFKAHFQLHCRALSIPWFEKKITITCLKKREYSSSSSFPVRYIPKKSSQSEKFENLDSKQVKGLKGKDLLEYSESSRPLKNEVGYGESLVQKGFNFNAKPRYQSKFLGTNVIFDDQDKYSVEESEDESENDDIVEERKDLSICRRFNGFDQGVLQSVEHKKTNNDEKFATSSNFDTKPRYQSHMLVCNELVDDVEQDDNLEEPVDVSEDYEDELSKEEDDIIEEHEDVGEELSNQRDVRKPPENKTKLDTEKAAVKLLARRAYTAVQLSKKLSGKKFPPNYVQSVITDFQSRGWINDGLYAEAYCRSRWTSSTWGPRRIKLELSRKGVSKLDSDKAIKLVFKDRGGSKDDHEELRYGLSKASFDHLYVQASKQWVKGVDLPEETRKARVVRWLQYRGFNWDVIFPLLKKLKSNHH